MTTINPDAVIDAIARLFPDGFDYHDRADSWPESLLAAIGHDEPSAGFNVLCGAVDYLKTMGRLRETTHGFMALSWTEQAWRARAAMAKLIGEPISDAELVGRLANVLAGKTEKKA